MGGPLRMVIVLARFSAPDGVQIAGQMLELVGGWGWTLESDERRAPDDGLVRFSEGGLSLFKEEHSLRLSIEGTDLAELMRRAGVALELLAPSVSWAGIGHPFDGESHLPRVSALQDGCGFAIPAVDLDKWFQPGVQWPPGMDVRRIGESLVVTRLLDVEDRATFERLAMPQNMALWVQTYPGSTRVGALPGPNAPPRGPAVLQAVGLDAATREVEYAADVSADGRVRWWELAQLKYQVRTGVLADGQRIAGVRVVFSREDAARANLVPLLDCGVSVYCYDSDGDLVILTWEED